MPTSPINKKAFSPTPARIGDQQYRISRIQAALLLVAAVPLGMGSAAAANFTISTPSTTAQTLGTASGQTGTVTATGSLTVSGSTVAVTVSGNNATLTNLGTISQTGAGRVIRDNTGVSGLMITNGSITNATALLQSADADVIQINKAVTSVTLNNYGSLISLNASAGGAQAVDFTAITSGANVVNNYTGSLLKAYEADAVRTGVNSLVYNAGAILSITTKGSSSDGIDTQNNSGAQITNASTGLIEGGRHGITGGALNNTVTFTTSVTNNLGGIIKGNNGSGINLDGFNALQTATIINHGTITGNGITGDGDGIDADGLVNITNTGTIRSINAFSASTPANSEGITAGGGTITNSGTIEGRVAAGNTNAVGRGITLAGNDIASGPLAGTREAIYGNAVITNQTGGLIKGQSDSAIVVEGPASGFTVTINNNAGATILGGGATNAAIRTGADNDTVNNAGTINGASSGKAIDLGAGNNALYITGGVAVVNGDINGGVGGSNTLTINPGAGNSFAYGSSISNFNSVEVKSGTVTLTGVNTYTGTTLLSGGLLILDGANRVSASSVLNLNGGTLEIANAGGANGQTFASLVLSDSSTIDLDFTSLTLNGLGTIGFGKSLTILDYLYGASPNYAFRLLGDYSTNVIFLALIGQTTINGLAANYQFDGIFTDVTPVPEADAYVMWMAGLVLLGTIARRRKYQASA